MSFWSTIGKIVKPVANVVHSVTKTSGTILGNVVGGWVGDPNLGNQIAGGVDHALDPNGVRNMQLQASINSPHTVVPAYSGNVGGLSNLTPVTPVQSYGVGAAPVTSLSGMLSELPGVLGVLSGNTPIQVSASSPALPNWLFPACIGGFFLIFLLKD